MPSTFGITAVETNANGYTLTFCYECTITPSGGTPIIFIKDTITIVQNPLDCSLALTDAGYTNPAAIAFNSVGSSVSVAADYLAIFSHTSTVDCPVDQCSLMEPGCGSALAAQSNVVLGPDPYEITAIETNTAGYSTTFCLKCMIGANEFFKDSITIAQNPLDCSLALSDAGFVNPPSIAYNSAG